MKERFLRAFWKTYLVVVEEDKETRGWFVGVDWLALSRCESLVEHLQNLILMPNHDLFRQSICEKS